MSDTVDVIGGWVQAISVIVIAASIGIGVQPSRKERPGRYLNASACREGLVGSPPADTMLPVSLGIVTLCAAQAIWTVTWPSGQTAVTEAAHHHFVADFEFAFCH